MATSTVPRLAPATARDGVDTRKKVNWARAVAQPRKTICRSDAIIGLGNPAVTNWGDMMTGMYGNRSTSAMRIPFSRMRLYEDMADEPWKYSDEDMIEWSEMDDTLRAGPERAEVEAYWAHRVIRDQAEERREEERYTQERVRTRRAFMPIMKEAARVAMKRRVGRDITRHVKRIVGSIIKIQATFRGYRDRCGNPHLDCCMCLSHRISPLKTSVGYMCRECAALGPYEDRVDEDPWNWHRAEYVDEAPYAVQGVACVWCTKDMPLGCWDDYCSYECEQQDRTA
jgi:hypothetical protein